MTERRIFSREFKLKVIERLEAGESRDGAGAGVVGQADDHLSLARRLARWRGGGCIVSP